MTADATRIGIGLAGVKANDHRIRAHLVITLLEAVKERDAPLSCRIAEMSNSRATGKIMRRMKGNCPRQNRARDRVESKRARPPRQKRREIPCIDGP
jgi:hypothetical protein